MKSQQLKFMDKLKEEISSEIIKYLKNKYGKSIEVLDEKEKAVNIFNTKWYKVTRGSIYKSIFSFSNYK